jgi:hypothetical protein
MMKMGIRMIMGWVRRKMNGSEGCLRIGGWEALEIVRRIRNRKTPRGLMFNFWILTFDILSETGYIHMRLNINP